MEKCAVLPYSFPIFTTRPDLADSSAALARRSACTPSSNPGLQAVPLRMALTKLSSSFR